MKQVLNVRLMFARIIELCAWGAVAYWGCSFTRGSYVECVLGSLFIASIAMVSRHLQSGRAWLFSTSMFCVVLICYSILLGGDGRSSTQPGLAALDALWSGFVLGTGVWLVTMGVAGIVRHWPAGATDRLDCSACCNPAHGKVVQLTTSLESRDSSRE
jgi:hypothetical protein